MGGKSKKTTVGYKYYIGMHMVLCHGPVDSVRRIIVDGKTAWVGDVADGQITINSPNLFGGESREGGISGTVDIMGGGPSQGVNSYLQSKIGGLIPAFRGVTSVVLRQVYVGLSPYLKKWSFRVSRIHKRFDGQTQWYDEKSEINSAVSAILSGPWQYAVLPYHSNPGYEQLTPPVTWQGEDTLPFGSNKVWLYPTPPGWPTPQLSVCWIRKTVFDVPEGLVIQIRAENGCLLWINGQYVGASNRDNLPIPNNEQYPVEFVVPARGTYEILVKAFSEGSSDQQSGNSISITLQNIPGGADMNPAHIIRECLTDPDWGMGYSDADVDDQSFMAAADQLYNEGMGISILWDRQTPIEDFIGEILRHIDAALYVDRKTGKFTLKLIRGGYNKDSLLHLNEDNIFKIENFTRPAFGELTNSVTVNYWDANTGKDASVTAQDIALQQMQGVTIGTTIQYPGFTNSALASRVAQRDLKALSSQRASCTIYADRTAKDLTIGDVFKLSWADYNLSEVVMRVTGIAYGDGRTNRIKITCTEDAFDLPETELVTPDPPQWENPSQAPRPITRQIAFEAPYLELVQRYGQDVVDARLAANPDAGYVGAAGVSPGGAAINARVYTNNGSGYEDIGALDFSPGASLAVAVDQLEETFILDQGSNLDLVNAGTWGQIDEELFAVVSINGNTMTVKRGVLDTVVRPHAAGTPIIFWDEFSTVDDTEYVTSEQVAVKLVTVSGSGELPLEQATEMSVTMRGRANRPYPPGNFKVNGQYFPSEVNWGEPVLLSWAHRDRLQQTGANLIDFTASDIGPEPGVSYVVRLTAIFSEDPPLKIYEEGGILGNTHIIDPELVTIPPEAVSILLEVASERDGLESMWAQSHEVWTIQAPYNLKAVYTED